MNMLNGLMDAHRSGDRDWYEPPSLTLDARGVIIDCSGRAEEFFGYTRAELASEHVSKVLPQLTDLKLLQYGELNAHLSFLSHIGYSFEVKPRSGMAFLCGLSFVCLTVAGQTIIRLIAQSSLGTAA